MKDSKKINRDFKFKFHKSRKRAQKKSNKLDNPKLAVLTRTIINFSMRMLNCVKKAILFNLSMKNLKKEH